MSFNVGEHVVYGANEICRIEEKVKRCFDGVNEREYFKLIPVYSKGSVFYIPADNYDGKVRKLLTKEEIYELIDEMPDAKTHWCEDKNQRKNEFFSVLHSDNYRQLIAMMRSLYLQRKERNEKGKKLNAADSKVMQEAEKLIYHEFAFVLGIDEKEVNSLIESRISAVNNE
ncbi:MAG: CarD family transcriptional regulator [Clostridium sp.]|nr:CarD family transcriptional regulator [Clostridium sp.]MCM1547783.1 CarD family transcriptional regulator [Ruminococcus sp.]